MSDGQNSEVSKRVLIVDDEDEIGGIFSEALASDGWTVDRALSARQALTLFDKNEYDLITLDCMMPEVDGREFHQSLSQIFGHGYRSSQLLPQRLPPILVVTAWFDEVGMQELVYGERILGVLRKPVSCKKLKESAQDAWLWDQERKLRRSKAMGRIKGALVANS